MNQSAEILAEMLAARLPEPARQWLDTARAAARRGDPLLTAFALASRHAGRAPLSPTAAERNAIHEATAGVDVSRWSTTDAVRAVLLATLADAIDDTRFAASYEELFEAGDAAEQQSALRALCLLPKPERFLPLAIDACRTNIVPLFESIACDSPYPQRYFPEGQFNQLVIKALFLGVPLARIVGLRDRRNAELTRIALDFAAERRAAGRPTPADLPLALAEPSPAESR